LAATYTPIASITLGAAVAEVTFTSIPSIYTDLVLVAFTNQTSSIASYIQFNGDTATNYSNTNLTGDGTSATSNRVTSSALGVAFATTSANDQISILNIMNYSNTTTNKTFLLRRNDAAAQISLVAGLWRSTAAISSMRLYSNGSTFTSNSTFNLYGIQAGNA
jgi:hypothetical protein